MIIQLLVITEYHHVVWSYLVWGLTYGQNIESFVMLPKSNFFHVFHQSPWTQLNKIHFPWLYKNILLYKMHLWSSLHNSCHTHDRLHWLFMKHRLLNITNRSGGTYSEDKWLTEAEYLEFWLWKCRFNKATFLNSWGILEKGNIKKLHQQDSFTVKIVRYVAKLSQVQAPAGLSSIILTEGHLPSAGHPDKYNFQANAMLGSSLARCELL